MNRPPKNRPGSVPPRLPQQITSPWKSWNSVAVSLANIPKEVSTLELWRAFKNEGNIVSIDIFEDPHGNRTTRAKLRFRPPPSDDFWEKGTRHITRSNGRSHYISLSLEPTKPHEWEVPSPVRPGVHLPAEFKIPITSLDIGVLADETTMMSMRTVRSLANENATLILDLGRKDLLVYFQLLIAGTGQPQEYRLKVPFSQLDRFFQTRNSLTRGCSHITFLGSPPVYHRRLKNIESTFSEETSWREWDVWFRQTHVVHTPQKLATLPVCLRRQNPIIDIGRWTAFRINYTKDCEGGRLAMLCDILRDYNLIVEETERFTVLDTPKERPKSIWEWIDLETKAQSTSQASLHDLVDSSHIHLPFQVRYQLEVCISQGFLSEFNMTHEFALKLAELKVAQATRLLEHVALQKKVYFRPMEIFDLKFVKGVTLGKVPAFCCQMRSARITPSTVYYNVPSVDISNRVIRHHINLADNFLRVRFTDEKHLGRINATADNTMDEVFTRIKRALANGITIGSTRYDFLAFGNSQFREHGAYFFAPKNGITAASIRAWMGQFSHIRNIAKHAARLGQCFSTTRAVVGCTVETKRINDITRNGYTFSDGVGKISQFVADMATSELKIKKPTGKSPCAYQFRQGGSKGLLVVSPDARRQEIHIRESQYKFAALHQGLEIIRWSQFTLATLNRQLILVLSTLGISDSVFHLKLKTMLKNLDEAMQSDPKAVYLLSKYVDPNQVTLTLSQMVLDGFRRSNEPFVTSLLNLWRAWHLKFLKEKARIVIDKGACLLGCMDETATLKGYFFDRLPERDAPLEKKISALPEIFVQVYCPDDGGKYEIIEGLCILARNPSLHPGDIRVVRAINVPALKHLKDVVVLPQTGNRDVASMCSGGDLDGDDYLVIWDQDLLPDDWFCKPMNYTSEKAHDLDHDVTVDEITSFFVTYMKNDSLPRIAHAHLAWGDFLDNGVNEARCMQLAQLHSDAVDYNKTGNPAVLTRKLKPRKWPHFMEKNNKPARYVYHSGKILGQLYDAVERIDFVPSLEASFDERILDCQIEVTEEMHSFARELKDEYDTAIRRIMAQHEIKTEFEVWSTFVLSHSNMSKDYKFHEEIGAISSALIAEFRDRVYGEAAGRTFELLAPLAVAMYQTTHAEIVAALAKHREENPSNDLLFDSTPAPKIEQLPLISFPWILSGVLGQIAIGQYEHPGTMATPLANLEPHQLKSKVNKAMQTEVIRNDGEHHVDNDPFGLNLHGETATAATIGSSQMISNDVDIDSLEQLLDFGLLRSPSTPSSSLVFPSAPVKEGNLLDLDRDPIDNGWSAPGKAAINQKENHLAKEVKAQKGRIVEAVEEEYDEGEDILGIDKLSRLVGI
ncbi:RNA dependent RNA polymerase-domain-containing protein [Aspergillus crustosus]